VAVITHHVDFRSDEGLPAVLITYISVYQAVHVEDHRVAACKVVSLTKSTTAVERKTLDKEMRVHAALKHSNVLEFLNAAVVEPDCKSPYFPAIYMLLEFAAGGDLFDKIGTIILSFLTIIS